MPKAVNFAKGSIIYFKDEKADSVFVIQKGGVILSSIDFETREQENQTLGHGEFFGVKSALGNFNREETATAFLNTVLIKFTVPEFEAYISTNKNILLKMLKVFSRQLRSIHKTTTAMLSQSGTNPSKGLLSVADAFYQSGQYNGACDVYKKYMALFPNQEKPKYYSDAVVMASKYVARQVEENLEDIDPAHGALLKAFSNPVFERFEKNYNPGQVIISEYEPGDSFYLILSGQVQLIKYVNGNLKNLDILKAGEVFGEMAILDNSPRSASLMAIGKVKCLEFNKANFELLLSGNPQMALVILRLFCKRIYDQKKRFNILRIADPMIRVAEVFLILDEMNSNTDEHNRERVFNISTSEIARWAGLEENIIYGELQKLEAQRKLILNGNEIHVPNILDLKRMSDSYASGISILKK